LAEDLDRRAFPHQGITFAGDGFDESGLAASVRSEDGDVFADADAERYPIEGEPGASDDRNLAEFDERMGGAGHDFECSPNRPNAKTRPTGSRVECQSGAAE